MDANTSTAPRSAFNVQADLRDNGSLLLITVDLMGDTRDSATGKSKLLGSTGFPVKLEHPELGTIWYSCTVGQESEQYAALKQEAAALRAKLKSFGRK